MLTSFAKQENSSKYHEGHLHENLHWTNNCKCYYWLCSWHVLLLLGTCPPVSVMPEKQCQAMSPNPPSYKMHTHTLTVLNIQLSLMQIIICSPLLNSIQDISLVYSHLHLTLQLSESIYQSVYLSVYLSYLYTSFQLKIHMEEKYIAKQSVISVSWQLCVLWFLLSWVLPSWISQNLARPIMVHSGQTGMRGNPQKWEGQKGSLTNYKVTSLVPVQPC